MKQRILLNYTSILSCLILCLSICCDAFGQSPKEKLLGYWTFKRGQGGPCARLILELEYSFEKNGRFHGKTRMSNNEVFEYTGTFEATDTDCTTYVNGATVGPYAYTIEQDLLTISMSEYNCNVQLVREDY